MAKVISQRLAANVADFRSGLPMGRSYEENVWIPRATRHLPRNGSQHRIICGDHGRRRLAAGPGLRAQAVAVVSPPDTVRVAELQRRPRVQNAAAQPAGGLHSACPLIVGVTRPRSRK